MNHLAQTLGRTLAGWGGTAALCLALMSVLSACENTGQAQVSVRFEFDEPPADSVPYWVTVRVTADNGARTLVASAPTPWERPWRLSLDAVPNGSGREVRVEFRRGAAADLRVEYYGISDPFALAPGDRRVVDVRVALRQPLTDVGNTLSIAVGDGAPNALADPRLLGNATLHIQTRDAVSVTLSNEADFSGAETLVLAQPPPAITCTPGQDASGEPLTACVRPGWDLTARAAAPDSGVYTVHAVFRDAEGYVSAPVIARVAADVDPPILLNAAVVPPFSSPGRSTVVSITANEQLLPPVLAVDPPLEWPLTGPESADGKTWIWRGVPDGYSASHTFSVTVADTNGQAPRTVALRERPEDPESAPLVLEIDATEPLMWTVAPFRVVTNGQTTEFTQSNGVLARYDSRLEFALTAEDDTGLDRVTVFVDGSRIPCAITENDRFDWVIDCVHDLAEAPLLEGLALITATVADLAGNQRAIVAYQVTVDETAPWVVEPALLSDLDALTSVWGWTGLTIPADGKAGLMISVSEPLEALPVVRSSSGWSGVAIGLGTEFHYDFYLGAADLGPGDHTLTVELVDRAGLTSSKAIGLLTVLPW